MEYKITPSSRGVTMPAFIVYESCHCDTRREAAAAVERMKKKHH